MRMTRFVQAVRRDELDWRTQCEENQDRRSTIKTCRISIAARWDDIRFDVVLEIAALIATRVELGPARLAITFGRFFLRLFRGPARALPGAAPQACGECHQSQQQNSEPQETATGQHRQPA